MFAKTEVFENAPQSGGFWKRRFNVLVWTGENGGFRKRLRHCSFACPGGNSYFSPNMRNTEKVRSSKDWWRKRMFLSRFRRSSVDGGKRCENANVDVITFMRLQETENGGFRNALVWTGPKNVYPWLSWKHCTIVYRNNDGATYWAKQIITIHQGSRSCFLFNAWFTLRLHRTINNVTDVDFWKRRTEPFCNTSAVLTPTSRANYTSERDAFWLVASLVFRTFHSVDHIRYWILIAYHADASIS